MAPLLAQQRSGTKSVLGLIADMLFVAALMCVLFAALMYTGLQLYGFRFYEVTSTSMSGTFDMGAVVAVKSTEPHKIKDGDIIAFTSPRFRDPIIHRVEAIANPAPDIITAVKDPNGKLLSETWSYAHRDFYTKGDANPTSDIDPVPQENLIGKFQFEVPWPFNLLVTKFNRQTLMLLGVSAIGLFMMWELLDGLRQLVKKKQGESVDAGTS